MNVLNVLIGFDANKRSNCAHPHTTILASTSHRLAWMEGGIKTGTREAVGVGGRCCEDAGGRDIEADE